MNFIEFQIEKGDFIQPVFINVESIIYFQPHPTLDDYTQIGLVDGKHLTVKNMFTSVRGKLGIDKPKREAQRVI
jgi:hypothetical protein